MSFLGFGLPPGVPSWGGMLSREGRQYMEMAPRLAIWPGLCLTVVVYSINMFGDALRDLLDPACAAASAASDAHRVRMAVAPLFRRTDAPSLLDVPQVLGGAVGGPDSPQLGTQCRCAWRSHHST